MIQSKQDYHPWDGVYRTFKVDVPKDEKPTRKRDDRAEEMATEED